MLSTISISEPEIEQVIFDNLTFSVLRLDGIHSLISGNKWYKLNRNLAQALTENRTAILTYGGANSNHLLATAAACSELQLHCAGVIRGEDQKETPTLTAARRMGMKLFFVTREQYGHGHEKPIPVELENDIHRYFVIPEGGNNENGLRGCMQIMTYLRGFDHVLCSCGTGTTFAGLVAGSDPMQVITGISVLRGENGLPAESESLLDRSGFKIKVGGREEAGKMHAITNQFAGKGYARFDEDLLEFKRRFESDTKVPLDHIYTVKLFYGMIKLLESGTINPLKKIVAVHSGGLQGNDAFERRYQRKLRR